MSVEAVKNCLTWLTWLFMFTMTRSPLVMLMAGMGHSPLIPMTGLLYMPSGLRITLHIGQRSALMFLPSRHACFLPSYVPVEGACRLCYGMARQRAQQQACKHFGKGHVDVRSAISGLGKRYMVVASMPSAYLMRFRLDLED